MTAQQRRILGVLGGLAVLLLLIVLLTSGSPDKGDARLAVEGRTEEAPATSTSSTSPPVGSGGTSESADTTIPLVPVTTGVPIPDAVEAPPSTTAPSATPAAPRTGTGTGTGTGAASGGPGGGTAVTAAGATMTRSPSGAVRSVDKAKGCTSAVGEGWKIQDCGALRTSGTVLLWLVETKGKASRALVLKEQTSGRWAVVLSAADVNGSTFSRIRVHGEDVSGDGQPELAFGFHRTDGTLAMDVVDATPAVVVHRDLAKGVVQLTKGEITTWAAAEDGYDRVAIRPVSGGWRASAAQRVARSAVPASML